MYLGLGFTLSSYTCACTMYILVHSLVTYMYVFLKHLACYDSIGLSTAITVLEKWTLVTARCVYVWKGLFGIYWGWGVVAYCVDLHTVHVSLITYMMLDLRSMKNITVIDKDPYGCHSKVS